jgi:hypothetical protein
MPEATQPYLREAYSTQRNATVRADDFLLHQHGVVATLKKMSYENVSTIKVLRVNTVQLAHAICETAVDCFDHQMIVIGHLANCVDNEITS